MYSYNTAVVKMKYLIVLLCFVAVQATDYNDFNGDYYAAYAYFSSQLSSSQCQQHNFHHEGFMICECNGKDKTFGLVRASYTEFPELSQLFLASIVTDGSQAEEILYADCHCPEDHEKMVLKKLNDNFFLEYEKTVFEHKNGERTIPLLYMKNRTPTAELEQFAQQVADMQGKSGKLFCRF